MKYKALISDLDGTLIPNRLDGLPSQRVIEAISKARETIHISIATGRSLEQTAPILDKLQLSGPVIVLNGALIVDASTRKVIYHKYLLKEDYKTVIEVLRKTTFHYFIDTEEGEIEDAPDREPDMPLSILVENITEIQADILIRHFSHIPTLSLYKITSWTKGKHNLNISHKLATKQHAIFEVAKILGINTHEIIGIGDGANDFPLLMACGLKVAMGNAIPDLKAIADHVTTTVEEDGVAEVIEHFVLNQT